VVVKPVRLMRRLTSLLFLTAVAACAAAPQPSPDVPPRSRPAALVPDAAVIAKAEQDFSSGRELATEGRHLEALPHFEAAARRYPSWALAHLEEARCRMVLNQSEAEIRPPLERALELVPTNPRIHHVWGLFHESYGRDAEARQAYRRAIALRSTYADALYRLALLEELGGAKRQARGLFERAFASDPENIGSALGAARLAEEMGDGVHAEKLLRQLIRQHPENLGYKRQLASLFTRNGKHRKARRLQAAIKRDEDLRQRKLRPLKPSRR